MSAAFLDKIFKKEENDKSEVKKTEATTLVPKKTTTKDTKKETVITEKKESKGAKEEKIAKKEKNRLFKNVDECSIIIKPLITEKAGILAEKNAYLFEVKKTATKIDIKKAFANLYGFIPRKVNTTTKDGKKVRYGKHQGVRKSVKKAMIFLKKGQSVEVLEENK